MASSIAFTDGTGAASLTSDSALAAPYDRFWAWTPILPTPSADAFAEAVSLTGVTHQWEYRTDYGVSFEVRRIAESDLAIAERLVRWLRAGNTNTCTVNTGDLDSASYTCRLYPGSSPTLTLADEAMRWYTLALQLKSTGSSPMTLRYA